MALTDSPKHRKSWLASSTGSGGFSVPGARVPGQGLDPMGDGLATRCRLTGSKPRPGSGAEQNQAGASDPTCCPAAAFRTVRVSVPAPAAGVSVQTVNQLTG